VPEARIASATARCRDELERVMVDFIDHKFDLLLATTIVESGLDIPNANTIFIDEADRYGLADLHQLRGRVGRYKHRAYCYLLIDRQAPHAERARRLRAIEEFSEMGPGSPSPCATWKSAARATCSARSRAATSRRSATSCTASFWKTPCGK
jgi:transcription-repair coupling factor (superfamily II helicase)